MLLRSAFLEGEGRWRELYRASPPAYVLQFTDRVVMLEGRLVKRGSIDPFAPVAGSKAASATSYCWFIWMHGETDTRLRWVAPACHRLEREGDYPSYAVHTEPTGGLFGGVE